MNDTDPTFERKYREMLMKKTSQERLAMASRMFSDAKKLVELSIICEKSERKESEIRVQLFKRFYSSDFSEEELCRIIEWLQLERPTT